MPTGNRFGIDLGNILSQASTIKSAKLQQEKYALLLKKEESGTKLKANVLAKRRNVLRAEETDESMQGGMEGGFAEQEPTLSEAEYREASSIAPEVVEQQQQQQSLTKFYESQGATREEAKLRAQGFSSDINNFSKEFRLKTKEHQQIIKDEISQQGTAIQNILEMSKDNPQAANKTYIDYREQINDQVKELYKQGNIADADKMQASLDKSPKSLIKQDGTFDTPFLMMSLSKMDAMLSTEESFQKEQQAEAKQTRAISLAKEKAKVPQKGTKREYQQVMDILKDPNLTLEERKGYEARKTKLEQTDRTSLLINAQTVRKFQSDFALKMGLDDPFKLATAITEEWTAEQQSEGNQVASIIVKGLGANAKLAEKKMGEYGALAEQMQNSISSYENVSDFRTVDETVKKYFSNYFGLSEKEIESTEAAQAFQSMQNIKIKADSGSAVSGSELVRQVLETATPFMTKIKIT